MASSVYDSFKDIDITNDELHKIGEALKQEEFRKLFLEYVEEINDPANKQQFQDEIKQLELERGNEVTFINPVPGYVIKTSEGGTKKAFINVCANENIDKPQSNPDVQDGSRGLRWNLPYSLAQPREDYDKKNKRCTVYDVVFHPDTIHLATKDKGFCNMVNLTACDAVENSFDVKLDRKNLKFPKLQYKGTAVPAIVRKKIGEPKPMSPEDEEFFNKIYPKQTDSERERKRKTKASKVGKNVKEDPTTPYTTPTFLIKHRSGIDLEEFTQNREARQHAAIPKELVVEISLPLLRSAADMVLDVTEKHVNLISEKPAKYKLDLTLPYSVFQDSGNAKFDKDTKKLVVTLPVRRNSGGLLMTETSHDSGVESDHGTSPSDSGSDSPLVQEIVAKTCEKIGDDTALRTKQCVAPFESFLNPDIQYILPEHNSHVFENTIAFTLNVKNVDSGSVKTKFGDASVHIKFASISSGFFPVHYAFYIEFHSLSVDPSNVHVETWDNNVVVQINLDAVDTSDITSYLYGLNADLINERQVEEPSVISSKFEDDCINSDDDDVDEEDKPYVEVNVQDSEISITIQPQEKEEVESDSPSKKFPRKPKKEPTYSESSGDELSLSCSQSPAKGRGILKRNSVSRSISESSVEEFAWASSYENCAAGSVDSVIPEEGAEETSTSLKKTVRFNDVVSRQLFRSNSSILGQKKKNQRKSRNKKRAQERRHSESEVSENDERKEGANLTNVDNNKVINAQNNTGKQSDLIFHLDM